MTLPVANPPSATGMRTGTVVITVMVADMLWNKNTFHLASPLGLEQEATVELAMDSHASIKSPPDTSGNKQKQKQRQ